MKKKAIILIIILVILSILGGLMIMLSSPQKAQNTQEQLTIEVGKFDLSEFQWDVDTFPSDKNIGSVDDYSVAIDKAKELWVEEYSMLGGQAYNPINGETIKVRFDEKNDCWLVYGTLPENAVGGVPHVIVKKDGNVIAVWCDD